jgi:hypothetical protein
VKPLEEAGHSVIASDIYDYGLEGAYVSDYLTCTASTAAQAIVTNPPFKLAQQFAEKAIAEVPYVALLLRLSFLESVSRKSFFNKHPPSRVWISSRRLPMMHRHLWDGPQAPSNTCHAWFIWHRYVYGKIPIIKWFDWKEFC